MRETKIYPSSMTFAFGEACLAESPSQCWRYQQLADGVWTEIPALYGVIGELNEVVYSNMIDNAQREVPFKRPIGEGFVISGRCDFLLHDRVDECKSISSSSVYASVVKDGNYKLSNLAQLVLYMLEFGRNRGKLFYGYYQFVKPDSGYRLLECDWPSPKGYGVALIDSRTFVVEVRDTNKILVDGVPIAQTVTDLTDNIIHMVRWRSVSEFAPRPMSLSKSDPCQWCPLKGLCLSIDQSETRCMSKAQRLAKSILENTEVKEVNLTRKLLKRSKK